MKRYSCVLTLFLLGFSTLSLSAQGWDRSYDLSANQSELLRDVYIKKQGGYVLLANRTVNWQTNWINMLLFVDDRGKLQSKRDLVTPYGDSTIEYSNIFPSGDGGWLLAGFYDSPTDPYDYRIILARYSARGQLKSYIEHSCPRAGLRPIFMREPSGNIWAVMTRGVLEDWYGSVRTAVYKFSPQGEVLVDQLYNLYPSAFDNPDPEYTYELEAGPNPGEIMIAVSGKFDGGTASTRWLRLDAAGNIIWEKEWNGLMPGHEIRPYAVAAGPAGFATNGTEQSGQGSVAFFARYDPNGEELLRVVYDSSASTSLSPNEYKVQLKPYGNGEYLLFTGLGARLARLRANGELLWSKTIDYDPGYSWGLGYKIDANRNIVFHGTRTEPTPQDPFARSIFLLKIDSLGNTFTSVIDGTIAHDALDNCVPDAGETPLANWHVALKDGPYAYNARTDTSGSYSIPADLGDYKVELTPPGQYWKLCPGNYDAALLAATDTTTVDGVVQAEVDCPEINVDLVVPVLVRCFPNPVAVHYCNDGTATAEDAYIDVVLDPFLQLLSASVPYLELAGNTIRVELGDLAPGQCGQFSLSVLVDCNAELGQTHCISAEAHPDTLCEVDALWSEATLKAESWCQNDSVFFRLYNDGDGATSGTVDYIIAEDDVVLMQGTAPELGPGADHIIARPAAGRFWRLEARQEPYHPTGDVPVAWLEGCGGWLSLGFPAQYDLGDRAAATERVCLANTGSFDPNDKRGYPLGLGATHDLPRQIALEYVIRFQNTGTDTAHTVTILDTLSAFLDPATLRVGASSHAYTYELYTVPIDGGTRAVLRFTFDDIMLPDSNVNEAASHGFIGFRIDQQDALPLGTVLENSAAIYFDFNEPVITNTTWHTVAAPLLTSSTGTPHATAAAPVEALPNPFDTETVIRLTGPATGQGHIFELFDAAGRMIHRAGFGGATYTWRRGQAAPGLYTYRVMTDDGRMTGSGRLIAQ
jgi:hypothetical protein